MWVERKTVKRLRSTDRGIISGTGSASEGSAVHRGVVVVVVVVVVVRAGSAAAKKVACC